jgi:DNA-binding NarL/FixJ family response regulator
MSTDRGTPRKGAPPRVTAVLVVDDQPVVRAGLRQFISSQPDLRVIAEASDLAGGLHHALDPEVGFIIVNLSLGRESGLDLVREVHDKRPDLPVMVLSIHEESLFAERALRLGARAYIMKYETSEVLLGAIRHALRGEVYVSPRVASDVLGSLLPRDERAATRGIGDLSDRELEVFTLIGRGMSTREIAQALHVSVKTVESHKLNIKAKLGVGSATKLVVRAVHWSLHAEQPPASAEEVVSQGSQGGSEGEPAAQRPVRRASGMHRRVTNRPTTIRPARTK